jgi:hypothetical protein
MHDLYFWIIGLTPPIHRKNECLLNAFNAINTFRTNDTVNNNLFMIFACAKIKITNFPKSLFTAFKSNFGRKLFQTWKYKISFLEVLLNTVCLNTGAWLG